MKSRDKLLNEYNELLTKKYDAVERQEALLPKAGKLPSGEKKEYTLSSQKMLNKFDSIETEIKEIDAKIIGVLKQFDELNQ